MSEPVLRRSGRNAAKKTVPVPPSPASECKKRGSAEPKNSTAKKIKTATDSTAIVSKAALTKPVEDASSSRPAASTEEVRNTEKPAKATSIAKPTTKPMAVKSVTNPAKTKKADEMSEGLKDGDLVPTDLPEIQTEDGSKTTIESLLKSTQKGIIIFAYPRGI